jgi:hypothetical protein
MSTGPYSNAAEHGASTGPSLARAARPERPLVRGNSTIGARAGAIKAKMRSTGPVYRRRLKDWFLHESSHPIVAFAHWRAAFSLCMFQRRHTGQIFTKGQRL